MDRTSGAALVSPIQSRIMPMTGIDMEMTESRTTHVRGRRIGSIRLAQFLSWSLSRGIT
jgi:hypothetical protein